MTGSEYQKAAMRTCNKLDDKKAMIDHALHGLSSEVGEVHDIYQKIHQGHEFDLRHVMKELGDVLWMIAELCEAYDVDLDMVMQMNIDKLKERYPEGFDAEHSLHRSKDDI